MGTDFCVLHNCLQTKTQKLWKFVTTIVFIWLKIDPLPESLLWQGVGSCRLGHHWQHGRLQLTSGDFHRQVNPAEARPVSHSSTTPRAMPTQLCPVRYTGIERVQCKPTNGLLMWGRYSHIDTSPHTSFQSVSNE
jgi:hypothetical protein